MDLKCFVCRQQDSERAWKGSKEEDEGGFGVCKGFDIVVSTPISLESLFEEKPVSSSLDLVLESPSSTTATAKWYLIKERQIKK